MDMSPIDFIADHRHAVALEERKSTRTSSCGEVGHHAERRLRQVLPAKERTTPKSNSCLTGGASFISRPRRRRSRAELTSGGDVVEPPLTISVPCRYGLVQVVAHSQRNRRPGCRSGTRAFVGREHLAEVRRVEPKWAISRRRRGPGRRRRPKNTTTAMHDRRDMRVLRYVSGTSARRHWKGGVERSEPHQAWSQESESRTTRAERHMCRSPHPTPDSLLLTRFFWLGLCCSLHPPYFAALLMIFSGHREHDRGVLRQRDLARLAVHAVLDLQLLDDSRGPDRRRSWRCNWATARRSPGSRGRGGGESSVTSLNLPCRRRIRP